MPGDAPPAQTLDELVLRLGSAPLLHQSGDRFSYGYSTTVLGAVIERATGMTLDRFFKQRIFGPLEMPDTGFFVDDRHLPRLVTNYTATAEGAQPVETAPDSEYRDRQRLRDGGGALAGTARDYLHFAEMIANRGTWRGRRLLEASSVDAMLVPRLRTGGTGIEDTAFGYGFAIGDAASEAAGGLPVGAVSWAGSGNTYFFADPAHRAVALFMTNLLTPPAFTGRTETIRVLVNRAALRLIRRQARSLRP
jgi:CubicO group peptidase (beta-lactamase class C family)